MKVGGHGLRDHIRLLAPSFTVVGAVWLLRLILSAADSPPSVTRMASVTVADSAAVLLAVILIHARRYGSYPNVVVASLLLNVWAELLIIAAIVFSVLTKIENIYTAPEYSVPGNDPYHLRHIYGHLTYGIGTGTLVGAAAGCLLLWLLRTLVPSKKTE